MTNILRNPVDRGELHGIKKARRPSVSTRLWNAAQQRGAEAKTE